MFNRTGGSFAVAHNKLTNQLAAIPAFGSLTDADATP